MNLLESARHWQKLGIATIPIQYMDKRPEANLLPKGADGKGDWMSFQTTLPTDDQLKLWFTSRLHNIAVVAGWNGLVILDFDLAESYAKWRLWVARRDRYTRYIAENTYQVKSARGVHLYIRLPHPEQNRKLPGIDIKAQGGYVLTAPSIHPSGATYREYIPGALPLMVNALSDILPADLLINQTQLPSDVIIPGRVADPSQILSNDPWATAQNVGDPDQDLIKKIRNYYKIEDFFPQAEKTSSNGRWYISQCPFHTDKNPSLWIDTQRQICSCYSGCTLKPLDVINLYARLHGLTNHDAIWALSKLM